MNLKEISPCSA